MIRTTPFTGEPSPRHMGDDTEPLLPKRTDKPPSRGDDGFSLRKMVSDLLETVITLCQPKNDKDDDTIVLDTQAIAEQLQCRYSHPFNQTEFKTQVPEVVAALPRDERDQGWCFGLSLGWCQQRFQGKSDAEIFSTLSNWQSDSLLLRTVGLQTIEQDRHLGQNDKQFEYLAALAGMECIAVSPTQVAHRIPTRSIEPLTARLERLLDGGNRQQALICMTDTHVMALYRDNNDQLHLFDPNYGVVSCDPEHKRNLCAFLYVQLNSDDDQLWGNKAKNPARFLLTAELQPSTRLHKPPAPTPLPALSLMATQDTPGPSGTKS